MSIADVMREAAAIADRQLTIQKRVFGKMAKQESSQFAQLQVIARDLLQLSPQDTEGLKRLQSAARRALKTPVGNPEIGKAQKKSVASRKAKASDFRASIMPYIEAAKQHGCANNQQIAEFLNARNLKSSAGGAFTRAIVHRLIGN